MPTFPAFKTKPYYDALKAWLTTSLNEDGTLKDSAVQEKVAAAIAAEPNVVAAAESAVGDALANDPNLAPLATPGAEGEVLTVVGGVPDWAPGGGGGTVTAALGSPREPERTLSIIGDLHIGFRFYGQSAWDAADARMDTAFADLATLDGLHARRLYVGDLVDLPETASSTSADEWDTDFLTRANALDDDWLAVPGNHDLTANRDAVDWATVYGMGGANWTADLGMCRVIGLSFDHTATPASTLDSATLTFLEDALKASHKDTVILCHFPLWGSNYTHPTEGGMTTYSDKATSDDVAQPVASVAAILNRYPHARLWVAGHTHANLQQVPDVFTHVWTGSRHIGVINAGALVWTKDMDPTAADPVRSLYLTMLDDRAEIRIRDHTNAAWETYDYRYAYPQQWNTAHLEVAGDNPATLVGTFDNEIALEGVDGAVSSTLVGVASYDSSVGDRTGLSRNGSQSLDIDPRPFITAETGSIVVRARFSAADAASTQYLVNHNPGGDNRIYLARRSDETAAGMIGQAAVPAVGPDLIDDTDIHTFGLSWRDGWWCELYVDGVKVAAGRSASTSLTAMTTIGSDLRFGYLAPCTIYDVYMAGRALSPREHAVLHDAGPWDWDTLNPRAVAAATVTPEPEPEPVGNPIVAYANFGGSITAADGSGSITVTPVGAATYESSLGPTGIERNSGQALHWDPTGYVTATEGSYLVRARFSTASDAATAYVASHNPGGDNRVYIRRSSSGALEALVGATTVPATHSTNPFTDTGIHTFGVSWYDGDTMDFYVDGVLIGTATSAAVMTTLGTEFRIASSLNGTIYEAAFGDRKMTAAEHLAMHDATVGSWSLTTLDTP